MALAETYYAYSVIGDGIPAQYEWYEDLDGTKTDVVDCAENDGESFTLYEITVRELFRTKTTVELESL